MPFDQTTGFDHADVHPQLDLPRISQELPDRYAEASSRYLKLKHHERSENFRAVLDLSGSNHANSPAMQGQRN
jgi:hypothetical protein